MSSAVGKNEKIPKKINRKKIKKKEMSISFITSKIENQTLKYSEKNILKKRHPGKRIRRRLDRKNMTTKNVKMKL